MTFPNAGVGCTCGRPWMSITPPPPCPYHSVPLAAMPCWLCGRPLVPGSPHINCADSVTTTTIDSIKWTGPTSAPYVPKHRKQGPAR